jgi:hypothetical protein
MARRPVATSDDDVREGRSRRRGGGGKLSRSEIVTVRLDPKLRYLAELAARRQRRTLSSFIEWAIEEGLKQITISEGRFTISQAANALWDVDEADRLVKLAFKDRSLLNHREELIWKLVQENPAFWLENRDKKNDAWRWSIDQDNFDFLFLRECWRSLSAVADGEADESTIENPLRNERRPIANPRS